jgi:hypothetical protein
VPLSDQAVIATVAYDVFTSQTPLVGLYSSSTLTLGEIVHNLGPLLFWLLAVPARLPVGALPVTMGAVNTAAVMGAVALGRRRGGRPLMFATAVAIAVMCSSFEAEVLRDVWNPSAPILPFTLLIFVCWSIACGEYRLLPLAALVGSFVVQCHLAFLIPGLGLLGVALTGLIAWWVRGTRGQARDGQPRSTSSDRDLRSLRRWSLAALVVAVVCWSAPLLDQALSWAGSSRGYGNLATLVDAARSRETPIGARGGGRAVARAIGVSPWWLRQPQTPVERTFDIFGRLSLVTLVTTLSALVALVALMCLGVRRGRTDVAAATALALVLCAALAAVTASFPNTPGTIFSYSYASWWAAPVGMWTWVALGWSASTLLAERRHRVPIRTSAVPTALALGAVAAVGAVVAAAQGPDSLQEQYDPTRLVVQRLEAELPHPRTVRVQSSTFALRSAVIHDLRRRGATVGTNEGSAELGDAYMLKHRRYDHVVDIRPGDSMPAGARLVARVKLATPRTQVYTVSVRRTRSAWPGPP